MDEISTGLDSSTTYQIIKYLKHSTHAFSGTTLVSLLQPDPETYSLFDDVILLSEGQIVYQGPRESALDFFLFMGFRCPPRKNVADFLQEVWIWSFGFLSNSMVINSPRILNCLHLYMYVQITSEKDQGQYWFLNSQYSYVPTSKFVESFQSFHVGNSLANDLSIPFDKSCSHPAALSARTYGVKRAELLKIGFQWQMLLLKRNAFVLVFKFTQADPFPRFLLFTLARLIFIVLTENCLFSFHILSFF